MGSIQGIMFRHRGEGIPDMPVLHLARLDPGANENFASMTAIQESGWVDEIYPDANAGPVQEWPGQIILSLGYVDLPCKFFFYQRRHRRDPWLPFAKEKKITFRVLGHEGRSKNPFIIGQPFMTKNRITIR